MPIKLSSSQKIWLSTLLSSIVVLIVIVITTMRTTGETTATTELNVLFWSMAILAFVAFASFILCTIWPSKRDRKRAKRRRNRAYNS